jgi:hypothetical protein
MENFNKIASINSPKEMGIYFSKQPNEAFSIISAICKELTEAKALLNELPQSEITILKAKAETTAKAKIEAEVKAIAEAEAKAKAEKEAAEKPSEKSPLFPQGHGSYVLKLANDSNILSITKTDCPLCGHNFDSHYVLMSRLRRLGSDLDLRVRYKDIEPLHYSIVTCPNCLYSAESALFPTAQSKHAEDIKQRVAPYKLIKVKTGVKRDTFDVFIGYYLALICTPGIFENHEMTTAGLWLKISRLYDDCKDEKMFEYAVKEALKAYDYVYTKVRINDKQSQQVRFIIGDLHYKLKNYDAARQFFFMIKSDATAPDTLKRPTEERIEAIRAIKNQEA